MAPEEKGHNPNRIPINFLDQEQGDDTNGLSDEPMTPSSEDDQITDEPLEDDAFADSDAPL